MDELELLATARPAEPPSAPTVDEARRRLTRQIYLKPKPRWRARLLLPVAAGALTVATGLALGAHVLSPAPPSPPGTTFGEPQAGALQPDNRPARVLLLAAAERTLTEPDPGQGRFWTSTVEAGTLIQVGERGNRYAVLGAYTEKKWVSAGDGYAVLESRWAGAKPASDADKAAWRKAGSPTSWPKEPPPGCPVDPDDVYTAKAAASGTAVKQADRFQVFGEPLTAAQVRSLPSDPDALKDWLTGVIKKQNLPRQTDVELGESLFDGVLNLLFDTPLTPPARAAAYRMLAGIPGVTSLGAVRDAQGRRGVAVAVTRNDTVEEQRADTGGPTRVSLVFDPDTGRTLAMETRVLDPADYLAWVPKGALLEYRAVESARWTDDVPPAAAGTPDGGNIRGSGKC